MSELMFYLFIIDSFHNKELIHYLVSLDGVSNAGTELTVIYRLY